MSSVLEPREILNESTIKETFKEEIKRIVSDADEMVRGRFVFNCIWDMEPCDEYVDNSSLRWNLRYQGDPEWTYMFTRFDYSFKLIIAYEATRNLEYVEYGLKWIDAWYKKNSKFIIGRIGKIINKLDRGNNLSHRTLDVAILAANITDYSLYCYRNQLISEKTHQLHKQMVRKICEYVYAADREFKTQTNWGPIENGYLLYASRALGFEFHTNDIIKRLKKQVAAQIRQDGSHTESSPMYLVEVLLPLMKCMRFCKDVDLEDISQAVEKGCYYLKGIATPDYCIPNIGDSDSVNISDVMIIAHELFGDSNFLAAANRSISLEYLYKYQINPIFQNHIEKPYCICRTEFQNQTIIRDVDSDLYILCSNIPSGPSGHKHCDFMSFLLYVKGRPVLIDCGRETYKDGEVRRQGKSPISHNTIEINGEEYWKTIDAWTVNQMVSEQRIRCLTDDSVLMSCVLGNGDIQVTRILSYIRGSGIIITDLIEGEKYRNYCAFFNVAPDITVVEQNGIISIDGVTTHLIYRNSQQNAEIQGGRCSTRYNSGLLNKRIVSRTEERAISHYFMFDETEISLSYENNVIEYVNMDTGERIMSLKL